MRIGDFIEVRGRPWLVEALGEGVLPTARLSCIADDAQGEPLEILLGAEVDMVPLGLDSWSGIGSHGTDDAGALSAYLRTIQWNTATAAERDLFQAPFRAGIRLDAYQLLPLRKALRLPRVNLLIADDVGLGKTIEAGLVMREMLLRRRIEFIVVAAPPAMTVQWQDELEAKFGLAFEIIDRERIAELRRTRGFGVNPWTTGSRFIISHRLLTEEAYAAGLTDVLGEFRSRALLVLDEAHHAAPASGGRYAVSSQFTKVMRGLAERFEHRLFLSATPHNGHSNSFSALLEILDPQRFTRGVEVRPKDLEPVMVRRLKADLRRLGEAFPERVVEKVVINGLPVGTPEINLDRGLAAYGEMRAARLSAQSGGGGAMARLAFVGLQQRLLSSVAAFARTLKVHRATLKKLAEGETEAGRFDAAAGYTETLDADDAAETGTERDETDDDEAAEAATRAGTVEARADQLRAELAAVDAMLAVAEPAATRPDARVKWLTGWIRAEMLTGTTWNRRRLIVFTEYEDTRRYLERRLREAIGDTDRAEERILVFSGATGQDAREAVKRAFNADPDTAPVRVLICTDAAREGINLQFHCADLVHFDLPWNPSRLEQRNGRIDRKLQPAKSVTCRYFVYAQREADIVLDALVRKTETIRSELGAVGRVLEDRIAKRLAEDGIRAGRGQALAEAIAAENDADRIRRARAEMDDDERTRHERLLREQDDLRRLLERSRERVGVEAGDLQRVVAAALSRSGFALDAAEREPVGAVDTFAFDPAHPAFAAEAGWGDAFDDLRVRPRKRGERVNEWRRDAPLRTVSFAPPILPDGRDAPEVVQVHLEHRLVRRLLSRFISQGFQSSLSRVSAILGPGAQPRVVLLGRLCVYGEGAARLHEEIIPVTAVWTEADRGAKPLRVLGDKGEATTLVQLDTALRDGRPAPAAAVARIGALVARDVEELRPALESLAAEALTAAAAQLAKRGDEEARALTELLTRQRARIAEAASGFDPDQLTLGFADEERREREADRRHWSIRLARLEAEVAEEPARIRRAYAVKADRLEPVALVYLWPASN